MFFSSTTKDFMFLSESGARLFKNQEYLYRYLQPTTIVSFCAGDRDVLSDEIAIENSQ